VTDHPLFQMALVLIVALVLGGGATYCVWREFTLLDFDGCPFDQPPGCPRADKDVEDDHA
jgi:hypothetical protein